MNKTANVVTYIAAIAALVGCASAPPLTPPLGKPVLDDERPDVMRVPCLSTPKDKDCKRRSNKACPELYEFIETDRLIRPDGIKAEQWIVRCKPRPQRSGGLY